MTAKKVYGSAVSEIIASEGRSSTYRPATPLELRVVNRRQPRTVDELSRDERGQLGAIFGDELAAALVSDENDIEAAEVVDVSTGEVRFRVYGWNYGVGYLFPAVGLEVIAFGSQHDLEHWHVSQREIFWAMDHAMGDDDHGFQQPLSFCWWKEECWDEIAGKEKGTVGSEPYIREQLRRSTS